MKTSFLAKNDTGKSRFPLLWDAHACLPLLPGQDMSSLERYRNAGFHHVSINVGMDMTSTVQVIRVLAGFRDWITHNSDRFVLARSLADIDVAVQEGRMAITFDLEGSNMLESDPAMVALYADLGVRQMLLAYNRDNACAGGIHGAGNGLTKLGKTMVSEMNRCGIIVDCAHASKTSSLDIMKCTEKPAVFSHANIKALYDHPRNVDNEQIKACAESGGVIGITGLEVFLGDSSLSTSSYIRQIQYVAEAVGPEYVGIGLDTVLIPGHSDLPEGDDEERWWPNRFYGGITNLRSIQPERVGEILEELGRAGFSWLEIAGIAGGNFRRVAGTTWL
ncbi:membrane dipeptidase (M19 family) [Pseudomonas fluorescens]|uniref:Membrane dipeptidase (M19 family) n=1 Tax=Pseudomonas fluorescens TaxID=294 RepID=A0A1T2Z9G6_PSEFL|nr:membrane dipeptidase [Pseudomonas fluorescens]OPB00949.1 membrane dipeptidase (M19 family) [Pseudomonas fluorescens]